MKVKIEQLAGERTILHVVENDGSPIASQEMKPNEMTGIVVRFIQSAMKEKQASAISIQVNDEWELEISLKEIAGKKEAGGIPEEETPN